MPRTLKAGYEVSNGGMRKLDSRHQAIQDQYQLQLVKNADGSFGPQVVAYVPASTSRSAVSSSRRASRTAAPARRARSCHAVAGQDQGHEERRDHEPGGQVALDRSTGSRTPSRPSACGGSAGGSAAFTPSATSTSTSRPASGGRSSARTAPARRRSSTSSAGDFPVTSGKVELLGRDVTPARAHAGEDGARADVPAVAPVPRSDRRGQHLSRRRRRRGRPPSSGDARGVTASTASGRGRLRPASRSTTSFPSSSASSRTASTGRWRSGWRWRPSRR